MSTSAHTKDSDALKESVEETIQKAERDFDAIEHRLTPGYLVDRAIFARRPVNVRTAFDTLQENPFGTTFLTLGTLMLSQRKDGKSGEDALREQAMATKDRASSQIRSGVQAATAKVKDQIDKGAETVKQHSSTSRTDLQGGTSWRDKASSKAAQTKHKLSEATDQAKRKTQEHFNLDNVTPLTMASLGLGLGAAIGAGLPEHSKERRAVGQYNSELSQVRDEVQTAMVESLERIKNSVADELRAVSLSS